ncbi:murein DD-endopeptidase MepM/ murein hydrolase activator NlpD [Caldalkalibacillus uzonensis]|uniref:Murein DD-endopeptidase MepM/ murein hydrolase activator NlpD n=1 Tax=Caldalkalibacillus uzonensis TaxID=353224 RepID=A0ABU0CWG8_9BACI|nr:M23 family metallopeptidase [Caldalkalibacillus uzonensis]MDQ0339392.1 murein DD-endopeptidase MepM/ murein hydrolase activator NlpD [Caldalkalibacillus uzonensis]
MGSVKKVVATTLVLTGGTALSAMDAEAAEIKDGGFLDEDLEELEAEWIENALRHYTNPLNRLQLDVKDEEMEEYITYTVQAGDTLSEIAHRFDIPVREIAVQNGITNTHFIREGQELKIRLKEVEYVVRHGDTLETIAEAHGVSMEKLLAHNAQLRLNNRTVFPGQAINIPTSPPPEPVPQPVLSPRQQKAPVTVASRSQNRPSQEQEQKETATAENTTASAQATSASASDIGFFSWPIKGTITSPFGMRWGRMHNGVDIANPERNAAVQAAREGVVKQANYHGGYGYLVIVDHGGGVETYYAHLSQIAVSQGQSIAEGEVLGYQGMSGNATGYHLHFEVRLNNKPLNPIHYLP